MNQISEDVVPLDAIDRKLLYALSVNARSPLSQIAKDARCSKQVALYRINNLLASGVISSFNTVIQMDKLGMNVYRVLFRMEKATHEREQEILGYFYNHKNVFWLSLLWGRWDLLVDFVAEDVHGFYEILKGVTQIYGENLKKYDVITFVDSHFFKRKYLNPSQSIKEVAYFGGVREKESIDELDRSILKSVALSARKTNFEIAKELSLSPHTVKRRLAELEKKGIIQGYSAFIRPTVYGAYCAKIPLYINEIGKNVEKQLLSFAYHEPNVVFMEKVLARWNYELDVECYDEKEFRQLLRRLKDNFADILTDYEVIHYYYDYKVNYLSWL